MKDTACIAIDLGATSGRVILAKMKHRGLEMEILNRFPNVIKEIDGRCYWDIYSLFNSIKEGLNMAASRQIAIDSIGVDTWGVDFVCPTVRSFRCPVHIATLIPRAFPNNISDIFPGKRSIV